MRFHAIKRLRRAIIGLFLFLASASLAQAQDPTPEPATRDVYRAPVFEAAGPIALLEAVRLTLEHDPNLLLREEDARFQEGVAQELSGSFDWTIRGELSYQHEERELRDSTKLREQERRDDLRDLNQETCTFADSQEAKAADIRQALDLGPGDVVFNPDDPFGLLIGAVEELIENADDDEERDALINQWTVLLESELFETEALAEGNRQACNDSAAELARIGEAPEREDFDTINLDLRAEKILRNGIAIAPFVEGDFESTQFVGKENGFFETEIDDGEERERFVDLGGKNIEDLYTVRVGFEVNVPLLRDRGREAVAAGESAAGKDYEAASLLLKHAASESVLNTTTAYWNLLAAQKRAIILEGSVKLQEDLVRITRDLIEGDELPRAELARALASEASARAQLDAAERDLLTAGLGLVQAMGYDTERREHTPLAAGPFPAPPAAAVAALTDFGLAEDAAGRRYDVAAAEMFAESGLILARAAEINVRSRLDLSARVWTTATGESSFSNAVDRWVTPSWRLGLAFEKPFGNRERQGRLAQSQARARRDEISAADLARNVRIAVVLAHGSLAEAGERLERAREAAEHFEQTVRDEFEKFKLGDSTLVDTVLTEQQRTGSLLSRLDAELEVAVLLAQLRFETGTLVTTAEDGKNEVTLAMITTLPEGLSPSGDQGGETP